MPAFASSLLRGCRCFVAAATYRRRHGITRETEPRSRRTTRIALTQRGREVIDAALHDHFGNEERLLSTLTTRQREQLEDLLHDRENQT